jgi:hypothetical protein
LPADINHHSTSKTHKNIQIRHVLNLWVNLQETQAYAVHKLRKFSNCCNKADILCFFYRYNSLTRAKVASFFSLPDHTHWHTTVDRTPLDEGSAHRRDVYVTTHKISKTQTYMLPAGFESAITASDRPQTLTLDRSAIGIILIIMLKLINY